MTKIHSERSFGFLFSIVCFTIGILPLFYDENVDIIWIFCGGTLLFLSVVCPGVLGPFNRGWYRLGVVLHLLVSPIILGILFFLVITPVGFIARIFGKLSLSIYFDKEAITYWIKRSPQGFDPESFTNQF